MGFLWFACHFFPTNDTILQTITYRQYRKKKLESNTVPTRTKPCQYSLSARLKANEEWKLIKMNKIQ